MSSNWQTSLRQGHLATRAKTPRSRALRCTTSSRIKRGSAWPSAGCCRSTCCSHQIGQTLRGSWGALSCTLWSNTRYMPTPRTGARSDTDTLPTPRTGASAPSSFHVVSSVILSGTWRAWYCIASCAYTSAGALSFGSSISDWVQDVVGLDVYDPKLACTRVHRLGEGLAKLCIHCSAAGECDTASSLEELWLCLLG